MKFVLLAAASAIQLKHQVTPQQEFIEITNQIKNKAQELAEVN